MYIGPYKLSNTLVLSPMAGITDAPFRSICRRLGAGLAVSEMVTTKPELWHTAKSQRRMDHSGDGEPRSVQIAGTDPQVMAVAAQYNVEQGAQIIDINMGCPAKKVCNVYAGSALLQNEKLVSEILTAVVNAVNVPVTLKIRTGWDHKHRNALNIAHIAEASGIQALAIHGRTRADAYKGVAEYDTIKKVKANSKIPIFANGDICTPTKAKAVLNYTGADGLLIGRAAQGNPWIFREVAHYLKTGQTLPEPTLLEKGNVILEHLQALHRFYGEKSGARIARKHIGWYFKPIFERFYSLDDWSKHYWPNINKLENCEQQYIAVSDCIAQLLDQQCPPKITEGNKAAA